MLSDSRLQFALRGGIAINDEKITAPRLFVHNSKLHYGMSVETRDSKPILSMHEINPEKHCNLQDGD